MFLFFWEPLDRSKEGVKHMPALQLAGIRQLIGYFMWLLSDEKRTFTQRVENDYYFKHFKFCLEQWFSNLRKIHQ
jgi:hypothetical protein